MNLNFNKFIFITDNHFCINSSVVNGRRSGKYSDRLENQIESIKWVNSFNLPVIHGGDFFNNSIITSEEQTVLSEIKPLLENWIFLRGNHESAGEFDLLGALGNRVIRHPTVANIGKLRTLFLPFNSTEDDIDGYYDLIIGHIGLEGIPFGAKGLKFELIDHSCDIFLNGHLHNRVELGKNKWNTGSLTAQNFSDNCLDYRKGAVIVDTEARTLEFVENPFALNFFKLTWKEYLSKYKNTLVGEAIRRPTSCISLSCKSGEKASILDSGEFNSVYYLRVLEENSVNKKESEPEKTIQGIDHLAKFREAFMLKAGDSPIVLEELSEVLND